MHFEIYRAGVLVNRSMTFISLSVSETLNAVDTAELTFPSPWCILEGDEFWLYDDGPPAVVLKFQVIRVEPTLSDDNQRLSRATMDALVGRALACTAIPTETTVVGATLGDLAAVLEALTFFETGVAITIDDALAEAALTAHGIETQALNAVEALRDIVTAAGLRWRTRNDLGLVVQYGAFGEIVALAVRETNNPNSPSGYDDMVAQNVFPCATVSGYTDNAELANVLIPEGGKWSVGGGQQTPLTLRLADPVLGFTITVQVFGGQTFYTIEEDGNAGACWKKIVVPNLVPEGDPPNHTQEKDAANSLASVAARYLREYSTTLRHFDVSIPFSLLGRFVVGNKITLAVQGLNCGGAYQGLIFVATRETTWNSDNTVETRLELSTRLESLSDPLSAEFGHAAIARRIVDTGSSFVVSGLANPNIIIPFGQTFLVPPGVVPLQNGLCTVTVVNVTTTTVELSAAPFPCQVSALIYPA